MFGGLNRLLLVTIVAGGTLSVVLPATAAASSCGSGTSAVSVYKECDQGGGGSKPSAGTTGSTKAGSQTGSSSTHQHLSTQTQKALNKAGKDKKALAYLVKTNGVRQLYASKAGSTTTPTAVGSAFDLTSGPTALLIVLAGTALLLVVGSGTRVWRTRRRV